MISLRHSKVSQHTYQNFDLGIITVVKKYLHNYFIHITFTHYKDTIIVSTASYRLNYLLLSSNTYFYLSSAIYDNVGRRGVVGGVLAF